MMKEFTMLTECELAKVDGGYTPKNCAMAVGGGMLSGANVRNCIWSRHR